MRRKKVAVLFAVWLVAGTVALAYVWSRRSVAQVAYDSLSLDTPIMAVQDRLLLLPTPVEVEIRGRILPVSFVWQGRTPDGVQQFESVPPEELLTHPTLKESRLAAIHTGLGEFAVEKIAHGHLVVRNPRTREVVAEKIEWGNESLVLCYEEGRLVEKGYTAYRQRPQWLQSVLDFVLP